MRRLKLATVIALSALLLLSLPAFADSWTVIPNPTGSYTISTHDLGGGDGSGGAITSLGGVGGSFTFSSPLIEDSVPNSWATWNCPPFTESCTPNVLYTNGATSLTITAMNQERTLGFELEPDLFQQETVEATFHSSDGDSFTLMLMPNGSAGALLFAVTDSSAYITSVDIVDEAGDDFAIAQLRSEVCSGCVCYGAVNGCQPAEPGTLVLLSTGLLGALGLVRRKIKP